MCAKACALSLFFNRFQGSLQRLLATHVDDTLSTGNRDFEQHSQITARRFDAKTREYDNITFTGVTIKTLSDGSRKIHQAQYAEKINTINKGCTYEQFHSRRHKPAWITHTHPHDAAEAAILAKVKAESFSTVHITQLNKAIKIIKDKPYLGLICHKLDLNSLHIVVHTDASFANLPDLKTQLGFVVLLTD